MTTLNIPTISRKKQAITNIGTNTFRVFGDEAAQRTTYKRPAEKPQESIQVYDKTLPLPSWHYNSHYEPGRNIRNRDKVTVNFLRRNVKTLNDPICYVPSKENGEHWWPSRVPPLEKPSPAKVNDSTMRSDYQWKEENATIGSNRHKYHVTKPALGAVPINWLAEKDANQRFYQEKISYEHQYDSRWEKNYPLRSRRHGAYVDVPISAEKAAMLLGDTSGWRVDTNLAPTKGEGSYSHLQEVSIGILPGLGDSCRKTERPNAKIRSNFDIAPRSNLNVRIREYIPSALSSAPCRDNSAQKPSDYKENTSSNNDAQIERNISCNGDD